MKKRAMEAFRVH